MENKFKESRFIEQIMVIGENEKFPAAFIVPCFAFIKEWGMRHGLNLSNDSNADIANNSAVFKRIEQDIETFNQGFGNWEQIKKFVLLPKEFAIDGDELTPTLKLKRKKILAKYQKEYQDIYN